MTRFFIGLIVLILIFHITYIVIPFYWSVIYDQDTIDILLWNGWGGHFHYNLSNVVAWVLFFAYVIASIGLVLFKRWARTVFLILVFSSILFSPFFGLFVITGWENVLATLITLGDGFILCMCYLTSIANKFTQKENNE